MITPLFWALIRISLPCWFRSWDWQLILDLENHTTTLFTLSFKPTRTLSQCTVSWQFNILHLLMMTTWGALIQLFTFSWTKHKSLMSTKHCSSVQFVTHENGSFCILNIRSCGWYHKNRSMPFCFYFTVLFRYLAHLSERLFNKKSYINWLDKKSASWVKEVIMS